MLEQYWFIRRQKTHQLNSVRPPKDMENLNMTPRIAENTSGMDAGISFSEMLQTPSKGKFSPRKLSQEGKRGS